VRFSTIWAAQLTNELFIVVILTKLTFIGNIQRNHLLVYCFSR